jgi:hypothetical protein
MVIGVPALPLLLGIGAEHEWEMPVPVLIGSKEIRDSAGQLQEVVASPWVCECAGAAEQVESTPVPEDLPLPAAGEVEVTVGTDVVSSVLRRSQHDLL